MNRERAQVLVEAVAAIPVCITCALALVDCGLIVRDRIAVTQAATRAASAQITGRDVNEAAQSALPDSMRSSLKVTVSEGHIIVRARSGSKIAKLAKQKIVHESSVEVPE